jgi:hypothetical protein
MRALPLLALLAGCSGALLSTGVPAVFDVDGDGFGPADGDCDDADPLVSPLGVDAPGDGQDQDCDGADDEAWPLAAVAPGELQVTEFLPAPVGVDSALGEWFEVTNTRGEAIDLQGLLVLDLGRDDFVVSAPLVVEAGASVVFGGSDVPEANGGVAVDWVWEADFGLTNDEDAIRLTWRDVVFDEVTWDATWPLESGRSTSRDPDADRWCLAGDDDVYGVGGRGTPGATNPACPAPFTGLTLADVVPGDLVITELMSDPAEVEGDYGEWFEVHNALDEPVDLQFLGVENDDGDDFTVDRSLVVPADGYVVFGSFTAQQVNGGAPVDWEWRWSFGLSNSGETVRLVHGTRVLDEVAYDPTFPDVEGASKSLDAGRTNTGDNDRAENWCPGDSRYGAGDLGTPGEENPPCP